MNYRGIVFGVLGLSVLVLAPHAGAINVRIASYNVEWGVGSPLSNDYQAVKSVINRIRPDVIGFQELTDADKANWITLAAELGYPYYAYGPSSGPLTGTQRLGYFSKFPVRNTAEVTEFPGAVELTRYPLRTEVLVPGALNPLVLYNVHFKAMGDNSSQFRRAIESRRTLSNLFAYIAANALNTEYAILGDFNDDVKNAQVTSFSALPAGLPASYILGNDVTYPVSYRLYPTDRFAPAGLEPLTLLREDSTSDSTYGTGGRLDYILLSPDIRENPSGAPVGEIYTSINDDGTGGLPKFGSPLPSTTSATASDHLLIYADINLIDALPCVNPVTFISEIVDHPTLSGANYIEIHNAGISPVNLTNYTLVINIDDVSTRRVNLAGSIGPGASFTVAANATTFSSTYSRAANLANTDLLAINGNDVIYLQNPNNQIVDAYGVLGQIANSNDVSIAWNYQNSTARRNPGITDPHPEWLTNEWTIAAGAASATPGTHVGCNQAGVIAAGPSLSPAVAYHTTDVSVAVTLNPNLVASNLTATTFYRINNGTWSSLTMANITNNQWLAGPLVIAPNQGDTLDYYVRYTYEGPNSASPAFTITNRYTFPMTGGGGGGVSGSAKILFNEIRTDSTSTDTNEFIELIAPAGMNLAGYFIRHHNGDTNSDAVIWTFAFTNDVIVPNDGVVDSRGVHLGFVVIAQRFNGVVYVPNADFILPGTMQQGPDGLILYDPQTNILDAIAWEGAGDLTTDDPGTVSTTIDPASSNYLHVIVKDPADDRSAQAPTNILNNTGTWIAGNATPGAVNVNQTNGILITGFTISDVDNDAFPDPVDNCPLTANPTQIDTDNDGIGDACDPDIDGDGIPDTADNCDFSANATQTDTDSDGIGDACDTDDDNDGLEDENDNCPLLANLAQADADNDGLGDECDPDRDGDGALNTADTCPDLANPDQADLDNDGIGNACDPDRDGDGVPDLFDNCPDVANANQLDANNDGIGNACTADADSDTIPDDIDNCPTNANPAQTDGDKDGTGDACDDCFGRFANVNLLTQPFASNTVPATWSVRANNTSSNALWRFDDPGSRGNLTGGTGNFAIIDSSFLGNVTIDTDLRSPVLNLADALAVELEFKSDFRWRSSGLSESANVDISTNGAAGPWSNVWRRASASARGPSTNRLDLTTLTAGRTNVMIRFRYANARSEHWWQIDDVVITTFRCDANYDGDGDGRRDIDDNCPQTANANQADLDADGIGDVCDTDIDGDGIPNDWEARFGLNPLNAADGTTDGDSDGKSNREEFVADTNPTNTISALYIQGSATPDGRVQIAFESSTNRQYQILVNEGALTVSNNWRYDGFPFRGQPQITSLAPANPEPATTSRFYRVMVIPPQ